MNKPVCTAVLFFLLFPCIYGDTDISQDSFSNFTADDILARVDFLCNDGSASSIEELWSLFLLYPDSNIQSEILIALGVIGRGNQYVIGNILNYLFHANDMFLSGAGVDYSVVSACIAAIMELGSDSSYPVLFSVLRSGYPEVIISEAYGALDIINRNLNNGSLMQFLSGIIERNPPEEKFIAFKSGMYSLNVSERGRLAEFALGLSLAAVEENADLNAMRYASVIALTSLGWTRADFLALRHYRRVLTDFYQNVVPKSRLVEAVNLLGVAGNSDAALTLALQLGLINARMEKTGSFDADITLAIVQALGFIGDNGAFANLFFASNLPYGENIRSAAMEAINRLKW